MGAMDRECGYFNPEREVMTLEKRRGYQLELVKEAALRSCRLSPGTKRQFGEAGLDPSELSSLEDLRSLPLIRKREFSSVQKKDPPFGGFTTVPASGLARIFVSPGPIYDPEGIEEDFWNLRKAFFAGGFREGDIVQNTFSYHLTPAGMMCDGALRDLGCVVVPTGVGNTEIQVTTMHDLKVTGYIGTPSYLMTIIRKAEEMGLRFPDDFALEIAYVAAEILPASLRKKLADEYGLHVRQGYITADLGAIGYECYEADGLHIPEEIIVEILDPSTGDPKAPGEVGEVVVTTLKKSYPLFRFATGDLSSLREDRCCCGRTAPRLGGVVGRADEVTKVRGMFVHPGMITEILERAAAGLRGQAVVTREEYKDEITLKVVPPEGDEPFDSLASRLEKASRDVLKLRVKVEKIADSDLGKWFKKIDDQRTWE